MTAKNGELFVCEDVAEKGPYRVFNVCQVGNMGASLVFDDDALFDSLSSGPNCRLDIDGVTELIETDKPVRQQEHAPHRYRVNFHPRGTAAKLKDVGGTRV